jgi:hypothetical protein
MGRGLYKLTRGVNKHHMAEHSCVAVKCVRRKGGGQPWVSQTSIPGTATGSEVVTVAFSTTEGAGDGVGAGAGTGSTTAGAGSEAVAGTGAGADIIVFAEPPFMLTTLATCAKACAAADSFAAKAAAASATRCCAA